LQRRARSRKNLLDSHGFHILAKLSAEDALAVPQQVPGDLLKGEGFPQLLRRPLGRGMGGDLEMHNAPAVVCQNQEHVQDLKSDCWHAEKVHRHHALDVILEEGPPGLRWRLPATYHVLAHARLAEVDAEFEQFSVDARRAPQRIFAAHSADQFSNLFRDRRSSRVAVTNLPGPEQPEALAVPGNDGFRLDDDQGRSPIVPNLA
jgi:hypothetical protein